MLALVHFLHILSGVVWAGGTVAFAFVVEPTLLRLKPDEIRHYLGETVRYAGPVMAISGIVLLATGISRTFSGGGVAGIADFATPYGLYVLAAFAIVLGVTIHGARHRAEIARLLAGDGDVLPRLRESQRRHALVTGIGIPVTIAIMVVLGLGLY